MRCKHCDATAIEFKRSGGNYKYNYFECSRCSYKFIYSTYAKDFEKVLLRDIQDFTWKRATGMFYVPVKAEGFFEDYGESYIRNLLLGSPVVIQGEDIVLK